MDTVTQLFEGECPTCDEEVKIMRVGGTPEFHKQYQYDGDFKLDIWESSPWPNEIYEAGEVAFECSNGHKHSAFCVTGGDWVAA